MHPSRLADSRDGIERQALAAMGASLEDVIELSRAIHASPEEAFEEFKTSRALVDFLAQRGFAVEHGVGRLPTAFIARSGSGPLTIALCAEYDALPNGHACGHNLIVGAALSAALGLQAVADDLGITVKVIGTPAEEHGGGKIYLLQDGAFDDVHAALMVHGVPDGHDASQLGSTSQAVGRWRVTYTGKSSHAAGAPHLGINAADAVVVAQVAVGLLRQQIPDGYRTNMLIREAGQATNIIAERAVVDYEVRAPQLDAFWELHAKVQRCFEAGALATGCEMVIDPLEPVYEPLKHDEVLCRHWDAAYGSLGRDVSHRPTINAASTDFGNVGQYLPGLHPWISVPGVGDALHSDGFRDAAVSEAGFETMSDGAIAMALTAIGAVTDDESRQYLLDRFSERTAYEHFPIAGAEHVAKITEKDPS